MSIDFMMKEYRPSKDEYYLRIAQAVSERSTCLSTKFGAIIVKDDQIISTGYNGAPRKTLDCYERGFCLRRKMGIPHGQRYELCRSVHSEQNAIINAARAGVSLLGADMFLYGINIYNGRKEIIDAYPCFICKKMIINAGIKRFVTRTKDGNIKVYNVDDWAKSWREKDMLDDQEMYK